MTTLFAHTAEVGKRYLTLQGLPIVPLQRGGQGIVVKAEWTGNRLTVPEMYLLQPYDESKLNNEWRNIEMATKPKAAPKALKTRVAEADGKRKLTREYKGKEYSVTVHDAEDKKGFSYDGKLYRSLTDVARTITGQKIINGPKFFGLR